MLKSQCVYKATECLFKMQGLIHLFGWGWRLCMFKKLLGDVADYGP